MSDPQLALPGLDPEEVEWVWADDEVSEGDEMFLHQTVMQDEVVGALSLRPHGVYVDATLGGGGHAEAILEREPTARVIGIDRDPLALSACALRLSRYEDRISFVRAPFGSLRRVLHELGVAEVQGICADLGVSSPQLDAPERGMSFLREGPIDMRMDPETGRTALDLIGELSDDQLANVLFEYGEERRSRRIARSIRRAFAAGELRTTLDLRRAIVRAVGPSRVGGVDPATRTFQALRIAVNSELDELDKLLATLPLVLEEGAIAAILSFHSLEDRRVKHAFLAEGWERLTKKPSVASDEEAWSNPRARSAKLRVARKISRANEVLG